MEKCENNDQPTTCDYCNYLIEYKDLDKCTQDCGCGRSHEELVKLQEEWENK